MTRGEEAPSALEQEVSKAEIIAGLRNALDQRYRRLRQAAQTDWERLLGDDPADACVTVRVEQSTATRGSGFLKSRRQVSKRRIKRSVPRFAR